MFVKNTDHLIPFLFSNYTKLNSTLIGYLDKNWCNIFYSQFFCKINGYCIMMFTQELIFL